MQETNIRKLQLYQLDAFKELHRICEKNDIEYYMIGGTLLGAVRHKGFIPWDIDLDVAMMREDYERFAECCSKDIDKRFFYQSYKTDKDYYCPHARICINNTRIVPRNKRKSEHLKFNKGIYIDIFPLDKVPSQVKDRELQRKKLALIKKIKILKRGSVYDSGFHGCKYVTKKAIRFVLQILPLNWINSIQDRTMQKYNEDKSLIFVSSMASHYGYSKQIMQKAIYGKPVLVEFEDDLFYAPEMAHKYLEKIYGDYMKLPPEEERHAQLDIFSEIFFDV